MFVMQKQHAMKPETKTTDPSCKTEKTNRHGEQSNAGKDSISNISSEVHNNSSASFLKMILHFFTNGDITTYQFYY